MRSRSSVNFICVLIQWLCYLIRNGNTHISSLKASLSLSIGVHRAVKAVGGKAWDIISVVQRGRREKRGIGGGRQKDGDKGVTWHPWPGSRKHEPLPRKSSWGSAWRSTVRTPEIQRVLSLQVQIIWEQGCFLLSSPCPPAPNPLPLLPEEDRGLLFAAGEFSGIGREPLSFYIPDISPSSVGIAVWTTFPCP